MFTTKSQFYQASSTGRFQFKFKPSVEFGGFPSLTPCNSDKRPTRIDCLAGPSDLLEKQKKHCTSKESKHHEDLSIGKRTFLQANKETDGLVSLEDIMQRKSRVPTLQNKRNLIPVHFLGDKNYPYPEIEPNFYKQDDGLVAGSNIKNRFRHPFKVLSNQKFYLNNETQFYTLTELIQCLLNNQKFIQIYKIVQDYLIYFFCSFVLNYQFYLDVQLNITKIKICKYSLLFLQMISKKFHG